MVLVDEDAPGDQNRSADTVVDLPELAQRSVELAHEAAREIVGVEALAKRVLDLEDDVTEDELEAAEAALQVLAPYTRPRFDARVEPRPAVPEELVPDGTVVLGDVEGENG